MAEFGTEDSVGARIKAARRARGYASIPALAAAIEPAEPSAAILANIESGRKVDLNIVQLLNVAMALKVPLSYLLAPMRRPDDQVDLPGLSQAFEGMTASEFDAWLAAVPDADYRGAIADERNDRAELQALREVEALRREERRLRAWMTVEQGTHSTSDVQDRISDLSRRLTELTEYLRSAGWQIKGADQ